MFKIILTAEVDKRRTPIGQLEFNLGDYVDKIDHVTELPFTNTDISQSFVQFKLTVDKPDTMKELDTFKALVASQGNIEVIANKKGRKSIVKMRKETDLSSYKRNDSVNSNHETKDHFKITLSEDIDDLFYFISQPIWN